MPPATDVPGQLAESVHVRQRLAALQVEQQVGMLARRISAAAVDSSWDSISAQVLQALTAGQIAAAQITADYLGQLLAVALGVDPAVALRAQGFAGSTSAGIPLPALLPMIPADIKTRIGAGVDPAEAVRQGVAELAQVVTTEVFDAARGAALVAATAVPQVRGWARIPNVEACDRCILLAGRIYPRQASFLRHPRCKCTSRLLLEGETYGGPSPRDMFDGLTVEEQDRRFGKANAEAIRSGANIGRVVNARSGMSGAGDFFTTSLARKFEGVRLSPYGCLSAAKGDHLRYLELLRAEGYIV